MMDPLVALIRRFAVEFMSGHDASVCREIMDDAYELEVGDQLISGRDANYLPAVQSQLDQFPGLAMTVHNLVSSGDRIALHFSEHGASGGAGGPAASWQGVALYRWNGSRLVSCAAEEDYFARRRQLKSGAVDPVAAPMAAPWDSQPQPSDAAGEAAVRRWLAGEEGGSVIYDDDFTGHGTTIGFTVTDVAITAIFSAGTQVAFHAHQVGRYTGGLPGVGPSDEIVTLHSAGIVSVSDDAVVSGHVIRDRAGLQRSLRST